MTPPTAYKTNGVVVVIAKDHQVLDIELTR